MLQELKNKLKKINKRDAIIFTVALAISIIIAILFFYTKRIFITDEQDSFSLSNYFDGELSGWFIFDPHGWYEKGFFNVYGVTDKAFNFAGTANNVYWDEHPPLWFWIMHFVSSIFKNRFSIWFGFIINFPCFVINCILIYSLVKKVSKNAWLSSISMLIYSLNFLILSKFIFIRSYQLESTLLLLFAYLGLRIINDEGNKIANHILLTIVFMLGGLNHYPFYVESFSLCICFAIYLIINKKFKTLIVSIVELVTGFLINAFVIFPGIFRHLGVNHGEYAAEQLKTLNINWDVFKGYLNESWGGKLTFIIGLILLLIAIVKLKKGNKLYLNSVVLLSSFYISYIFISYTTNFPSDSYIMPIQLLSMVGICSTLTLLIDKRVATLILISLIVLNINLSQIVNNINLEPSWDYAKDHQDEVALVYYNEDLLQYYPYDCYGIMQSLFADLRWYSAVEFGSQSDSDFTYSDNRNCVLYIENSMDQEEALQHIKDSVLNNCQDYSIEEVNVITRNYIVYEIVALN